LPGFEEPDSARNPGLLWIGEDYPRAFARPASFVNKPR
jgi:hypothetical protein